MQQQQQYTGQQSIMPQPPVFISTKDLSYLEDMMNWNLLAAKKAHFFAGQCQDPGIKQALEKAGMMHQRHYNTLLHHLQTPQAQTAQQPMQH
ncbi:hypothetical protein ACFDTO_29730 [Microbacteriaceae bacterium 4G12]